MGYLSIGTPTTTATSNKPKTLAATTTSSGTIVYPVDDQYFVYRATSFVGTELADTGYPP